MSLNETDIVVRKFTGADAPALLSVISDFLMALWLTPVYNIENIKDPKEFLVKTVELNNVDKIVEDIVLFTHIDKEVVSLLISFAANSKTGLEYKEIEPSMSLDEVLLVCKVVMKRFLSEFINTTFFLNLKKSVTLPSTMQKSVNIEK